LITTTGLRSCSETCALFVISPAHYSCAPTAGRDPRTTRRYDRARGFLDNHAAYVVATYFT